MVVIIKNGLVVSVVIIKKNDTATSSGKMWTYRKILPEKTGLGKLPPENSVTIVFTLKIP